MTGYCNNCGNALPPGARFCSSCGTVVAGMPPAGFGVYASPRLVRPLFGRQFAGVCAGLARTYDWDLGLIRVLTVVSGIFLFPIPEIVYVACWIGIPEEVVTPVQTPPQQF